MNSQNIEFIWCLMPKHEIQNIFDKRVYYGVPRNHN